MNPLITLAFALPTTSPEAELALARAFTGPTCARAALQLTQSARVGALWLDTERFQLLGTLRDGRWEGLQATLLSDQDPATPIEDGPFSFFRPGVGTVPGDPDSPMWASGLPPAELAGDSWRWVSSDHVLRLEDGAVRLSAPERVVDASGWVEGLQWTLEFDENGLATSETGSLRAGADGLAADVEWTITYLWRPCSG